MAGSIFCRKCSGSEAAKWVAVSRVGPSTRSPSTSTSNTSSHPAVSIIVVAAIVSAVLCLCIVVLLLRNIRRRRSLRSNMSSTSDGDVPLEGNPEPTDLRKSREGDEEEEAACNEGAGRRSAQRVEQLVVMAGEDLPTFLAHPVPAPSMAACNLHIQCPPLQL